MYTDLTAGVKLRKKHMKYHVALCEALLIEYGIIDIIINIILLLPACTESLILQNQVTMTG
ncbi:hypothetical protein A1232T_02353 [Psychrobacter piechaudii]|uniref:Uncharacterized protein n=1 Tax=Psychrobacter piechaudii TaxID=1945521 RepID=A0A1R4GY63_9GAMM|nr:hypothetical protein A1232T_02353 [Psychrobacter piechaudii]